MAQLPTRAPVLPHDPEAMLSLRNVRVSYDGREILHGINFDVQRGETLVILGGSGSGKSTLLRTLVGLEKPTAGEIWIRGENFATISEAARNEIRKTNRHVLSERRAVRLDDRGRKRRPCRCASTPRWKSRRSTSWFA